MNEEYTWPENGRELADRARTAWDETLTRLTVGDRVTGTVVARQHFGVFFSVNEVAGALAEAEIVNIPRDMELPRVSDHVTGKVLGFDEKKCQIFATIESPLEGHKS